MKELGINNDGTPFSDLLLRECEASTDPWVFWFETGTSEDILWRVYPTATDSIPKNHISRQTYQQRTL